MQLYFDSEVKRALRISKVYNIVNNICSVLSTILLSVSTIVTFISASLNIPSYVAGTINICGISILLLSYYFDNECRKKIDYVNKIQNRTVPYPSIINT
jgi:hypothetical protein